MQCGNLSGNELTSNLSGNIRQQSSQFAELLWIDSGIKSGISARELISTSKKKKKKRRRKKKKKKLRRKMNGRTFSKNPRKLGKRHHHQSKITSKLRCKHSLLMLLKIESLVLLLFLSDAWLGKKKGKKWRARFPYHRWVGGTGCGRTTLIYC